MRPHDAFWAALAGTGLAVELWALRTDRQEWTLSRVTRRVLRCDKPGGRLTTLAFIGTGAAAFANHLLNIPTPQEDHQP